MQDVPMQSIEFPSDTDGALSPPVRSSHNKSGSDAFKRKLSILESQATHAGPAKRQQTLMDFHRTTKSGGRHHHTNLRNPLEAHLQKGRAANKIHSGVRPTGEHSAFNGLQSELQRQIDARKKAAAAAPESHRTASRASATSRPSTSRLTGNVEFSSAVSDRDRATAAGQRFDDHRAEQDAWLDRASATARTPTSRPTGHTNRLSAAADREKIVAARRRREIHRAEQSAFIDRAAAARNSASRPSGHASLSGAAPTRQRPAAPTKPVPGPAATKEGQSILGKLGADAKKAKERQARELQARKEQMRATPDDITDSQAQREAEENHAISKPPPYQRLRRINTVPGSNHAITQPRPYESPQRNNTIAEANDDANSQTDPDEELVLEPSPPPQGPFSLNSAAGIRALQKSQPRPQPINLPFDNDTPPQTAAQRFMGASIPKTKLSLKKPSRNQDLLPITASDLKLYHWREQKINWAEVRQLYSDFTGITPLKSEDALRTRFRQVSKVVEIGVVTDEMCERVINGDEQAAAELNRLAAQYADISGSTANPAGLEAAPFRKIAQQKTPAPRGVTVPPPPAAAVAAPRPTQGGKNLNHDVYVTYLLNRNDANATDSDSDTDSRAGSPLVPEDCVRWIYFMKRRDIPADDLDSDSEDEDGDTDDAGHPWRKYDAEHPWREYDASFEHVRHANAELTNFIFTTPEGAPPIFRPGEKYELTYVPLENGMGSYSLKTERGVVQARVDRKFADFQQYLMPETKEGWLSKTLWTVIVKKTQRKKITVKKMRKKKVAVAAEADEDDLVGEGGEEEAEEEYEEEQVQESSVEAPLGKNAYGSLGHANLEAIREWVRLTMKPSSTSYSEFECRCEEARQELQRRLRDEGEGAAFSMVMEGDEKTVEVFARLLNVRGARN